MARKSEKPTSNKSITESNDTELSYTESNNTEINDMNDLNDIESELNEKLFKSMQGYLMQKI
ncbi:hypothetical protein ACVNP1_16970 [Staphylococcus aureus]